MMAFAAVIASRWICPGFDPSEQRTPSGRPDR
jgi:hypothetical protein